MRLISSLFAIAFLTFTYSPYTHASQRLSATDAWVKTPGPSEATTTAFVAVNNPTMYDDYLVTATTDVAANERALWRGAREIIFCGLTGKRPAGQKLN